MSQPPNENKEFNLADAFAVPEEWGIEPVAPPAEVAADAPLADVASTDLDLDLDLDLGLDIDEDSDVQILDDDPTADVAEFGANPSSQASAELDVSLELDVTASSELDVSTSFDPAPELGTAPLSEMDPPLMEDQELPGQEIAPQENETPEDPIKTAFGVSAFEALEDTSDLALPEETLGENGSALTSLDDISLDDVPIEKSFGDETFTEHSLLEANESYDDPDETLAPVPRITIAAFCERPDTAHMVEKSGADRRLSRAHLTVSMGGLSAAIEQYHDESTPNLIVIESGMRGRGLFEQLDELAGVCDAGTKVVVIGAANDIALYRELIRRGVSEYLVPPLAPLQLVRAVSHLFADPDKPFIGKVTAFIGAKGGVGSSTLAHNLAWQLSETCRLDTTILDLDLSFGTAGLDFNQDTNQGIGDALSQPDRLDDVLLERLMTKCTERLSLFTAPATLDREWELGTDAYEAVIGEVRATVPHIILDMPHTWSSWVKNTLLQADDVVIVASPDLACLRNAKNLYDLVRARRANDAPPKIIVNQVGVPKRPEISVKDFAEALGAEPDLVLPFEPALFGQATNNGQMLSEINADSKAVTGIMAMAYDLAGKEMAPQKRGGLFGGVFGSKKTRG